MVIGEQAVFRRKLNKHGVPVGRAVLTGFTLDFNMPLGSSAASNPANYQLDVIKTVKVKKKLVRVLQPIKNFTVNYNSSTDSMTLKLSGTQAFPLGGELTVLSGVTNGSGRCIEWDDGVQDHDGRETDRARLRSLAGFLFSPSEPSTEWVRG